MVIRMPVREREHNPAMRRERTARWTRRVAGRVVEHPGTVLLGAMLAGGVIAGALWAGFKLRQYRFARRTPYDVRYTPRKNAATEYEAVGI
jgi:hypothetical protein